MPDPLGHTFMDMLEGEPDSERLTLATKIWNADGTSDGPHSEAATPVAEDLFDGSGRYEDLGLIARGGMGEVRRVRDRRLGRTLAMKIIQERTVIPSGWQARFLAEARATAQLQHPGIVPVHDLGTLADGRLWFTMKEVVGRTLGAVIQEVHRSSRHQWSESPSGWTLRRLVDVFRRVCEAVAHAHSRGVVHRDIKPDNLMVGAHGEVMVMDWGIAKLLARTEHCAEPLPITTQHASHTSLTRAGQIAGTPRYMAPEQARGETDRINARTDVYSLGAVLYELLSGMPPYAGHTTRSILELVPKEGPVPLTRGRLTPFEPGAPARPSGPALPLELVETCERAMERSPEDRFASAEELAKEVGAWLEGARRTDQARQLVERARERYRDALRARERAKELTQSAASLVANLAPWQPESEKVHAWAKQDEAAEHTRKAEQLELEQESLLRGSLTHAPWLPEAHADLADIYHHAHSAREALRAPGDRLQALLRQHSHALPSDHPDRARHLSYIKGDGAVSLTTTPSGAAVHLYRYQPKNRRLVPVFEGEIGTTPLRKHPLQMGSFLCVLKLPGHRDVCYPVHIPRQHHWDGVPPGGSATLEVALPREEVLGPDDCYVPGSWFLVGGDSNASDSLPGQRVWCDSFVIQRFPVTNADYITFLDDLLDSGHAEKAESYVPRERSAEAGAPVMRRGSNGFEIIPDADGDTWELNWPVLLTDFASAQAYARWKSAHSGQDWRIPTGLEWEKAARGVDGRTYPWGDAFDPSWAHMRQSQRGRPMPTAIGKSTVDESPYGVRDMAGNVRDWCIPAQPSNDRCPHPEGEVPNPELRGGSWYNTAVQLRLATRHLFAASGRDFNLGFRLVRSLVASPSSKDAVSQQ